MDGKRRSPGAILTISLAWIITILLLAPMMISLPMSLTPDRYLSMPHGEISFSHYSTLISDPVWLSAIRDSVIVGLGATLVALVAGAACAIGLWQIGGAPRKYLGVLPMLPLIIPPIVSALALSRAALFFGLLDTYTAMIVSHAVLGVPFVFMTVSAALEAFDPRTLQAARSLGASPLRAILQIVVPNIRIGLMTGGIFAFFTSWDEIVITMFISSRNVYTLPRKIWSDLRDNIDPAVAAISTVMILTTLLVAAIYLLIQTYQARSVKTP